MRVFGFLAITLSASGCNGVFYHPSRTAHGDARSAGYRFEDHRISSGAGYDLHGRLFPRAEGTPRKGLWVFFQGNSRNLTGSYSAYAWVTKRGFDYFVFDYSGYGSSGGKATRETLHRDGVAALRFADSAFPRQAGEKLVLAGESLGGTVLLAAAGDWDGRRYASLIFVDCAFASYRRVSRAVLAQRFYSWPLQFMGPVLIGDAHAPEKALARLAPTPLLIAHCREDEDVPFAMGEDLFRRAAAPKFFWPLSCRHTQGFTDRFPGNRERLMDFVDSLPGT